MMNDSDRRAIQSAIDEAIAQVAEEQWKRLAGDVCDPCARTCAAQAIYTALGSLYELKRDGIPNYDDDWVALFYLTWYQPRQINLVYSVLSGIRTSKSSDGSEQIKPDVFGFGTDTVRFIDLGCGCLATMFGVTLAAADAFAQGQEIPEIVFDCIDTSPGMIQIGNETWGRFRDFMRYIDQDHPVCRVIEKTKMISHTGGSKPSNSTSDGLCFVTAIHCAYSSTSGELKNALDELVRRLNPVAVLLTTHSRKKRLLDYVFTQKTFQESSVTETSQLLESRYLERTTEWRKTLRGMFANELRRLVPRYPNGENEIPIGTDRSEYLMRSVPWWKNDSCFRIHVRGGMDIKKCYE